MTKIDIYSGFLGAGKTTLIKKLIKEAYSGEKLVLIENEFGEIGIDGGFLKESGIHITEMNSGCICCTLVGDFGKALHEVIEKFSPDRVIIEPSGVGKLSDVIKAVSDVADSKEVRVNSFIAVVDASKCKVYMKNFGEFFNNQIEYAKTIILSRTQNVKQEKLDEAVKLIRDHNTQAVLITTPWDELNGADIQKAMEEPVSFEEELLKEAGIYAREHEHHHHHDEDSHGHDGHDEDEHEHRHGHDGECPHGHEGHEHHHHDGECPHGHEGHEHHHHDGECPHGHEGHEHHHHDGECHYGHEGHHHADEIFDSIGFETSHRFSRQELEDILAGLDTAEGIGSILRAKGIVAASDGEWIHFDYVPEEHEIRRGPADITGRLCVIGSGLDKEKLRELFGI